MTRLFGTDGIRGAANVDLRPSLATALGRATAHRVVGVGGSLVVGQDTRRSGDMFVAAITAGATSMGVDVHAVGVVPTPALAFLAGNGEFAAGIMVSASHNPAEDNGLKVLDPSGLKLDDDLEDELEALVLRADELPGVQPGLLGRAVNASGLLKEYVAHRTALASAVHASGLHVVLDAANGAAHGVAPAILRTTGARVTVIHDEPDGDNINRGCGATAPESLMEAVRFHGADVGFALDGDADRCVAVDSSGRLVDGDQVLGILALERLARGALDKHSLVVSVLSNGGLQRAIEEAGGRLVRTPVGDKHIMAAMLVSGAGLGGEKSGHVIIRGEGDPAPAPAAAGDPGPPPRPVGRRRGPEQGDRRRGGTPGAARPHPRASLRNRARPAGDGRGRGCGAGHRGGRRDRGPRGGASTLGWLQHAAADPEGVPAQHVRHRRLHRSP